MYQVTANWYDRHVWICEQFGDPPVPRERTDAFRWIDTKQFKTVGWVGIIKQLTIKDGGWDVDIGMRPNLMSADAAVVFTQHEFIERWFCSNDGRFTSPGDVASLQHLA